MMGILERLRPQPRWKHADPAVRAAAVFELGPDDADTLLALAKEDADARVRRAAVARMTAVATLAEIARTDPDEDVRGESIRAIAGVAADSHHVDRAVEAVSMLVALNRFRELVLVARDSTEPAVRDAVIDALGDQKALGSISRHAADGATRLRALARLQDADEIVNVAAKSEHTDAAVAALERVHSAEGLAAVAQRARNKVAARRARTRMRALEEAARPVVEIAPRMSTEDRARALDIVRRVEGIVVMTDPTEAGTALAEARMAWAELQADTEVEPGLLPQFEAAADAAREAIAEREHEHAADAARAEQVAREQADRLAICEELESLSGPEALDRIAELKVRWDTLPPIPSEYAASLNRRFQDASRAFEQRERRRVLAEAAGARLETLATELEQLLASEQPQEEIVARWRGLRRDADVLREHAAANPQAAERLEATIAILEQKEHDQQAVRTKQELDNLRRLQQLARQLETLAAMEQLSLKAGERALRDIKEALDQRHPLPSKKDRQEVQARLETVRATLGPRVQELRDADEWQRWANLQVQEELSREMEALKSEANLDLAGRRMRELQGRWKQVALAPRAQGEAMWRRFKEAQDEVYARTSAFAAAQNEERGANLTRKQALVERAESLADSSDWVRVAAEIQKLQAEWKTVGPVSRGHEKAVWERFRAACDRFFTRRQEDLKKRKDEWNTNLARKEALCVEAEALADSTEWDAAGSRLKQLQAEWKTIGPVRKSKSDAVWHRFRAACDRFFERFKHRDQVDLQTKAAPREAVIRELEALMPPPGGAAGEAPENLYGRVADARARWAQAPELPRPIQQDLAARYHQAIGMLLAAWPTAFAGTDLDPDAAQKRMEKLVARVEELVGGAGPAHEPKLSPTELLAQQWRDRLAANTMGGRAGETNESRWRAVEQEIKNAQAQWMRLSPVPPDVAGPLNERFQRALRRFQDRRRRAS